MKEDIDYPSARANEGNVFLDCRITMGTILDSCPSDLWIGCTIDGTIDKESKAQFSNLPQS